MIGSARYLMNPERAAVDHRMPARHLASEGLQKIGRVGTVNLVRYDLLPLAYG